MIVVSKIIDVLVISEDYSDNTGKVSLQYIHTRNLEYVKQGLSVEVLSFSCVNPYTFEGIRVIPLKTFEEERIKYSKLISHAPNIRNHYFFLKKNMSQFEKTIIFFHGHEVLRMSTAYPEPFSFVKKTTKFRTIMRDLYDSFKFRKWAKFIRKNNKDLILVFVSDWMFNEFSNNLKIDKSEIIEYHIIHNSVGEYFEKNNYDFERKKEYDFITIRSSLDGSKYCIDVVNRLAHDNLDKKFLVIGKGDYFEFNNKSSNVDLINKQLKHIEIIELLNKSKYALLPTRTDSQGVMACEMLTFGIPLITSDIPVCIEMFAENSNVVFINNDFPVLDLTDEFWYQAIKNPKLDKFSKKNTVDKELKIIKDEKK